MRKWTTERNYKWREKVKGAKNKKRKTVRKIKKNDNTYEDKWGRDADFSLLSWKNEAKKKEKGMERGLPESVV